jgi:hypothetical protein
MKALSFIGIVFAAFLIFLGFSSKQTAGAVLSDALVVGGSIIAVFLIIVWIIMFFKNQKK